MIKFVILFFIIISLLIIYSIRKAPIYEEEEKKSDIKEGIVFKKNPKKIYSEYIGKPLKWKIWYESFYYTFYGVPYMLEETGDCIVSLRFREVLGWREDPTNIRKDSLGLILYNYSVSSTAFEGEGGKCSPKIISKEEYTEIFNRIKPHEPEIK